MFTEGSASWTVIEGCSKLLRIISYEATVALICNPADCADVEGL